VKPKDIFFQKLFKVTKQLDESLPNEEKVELLSAISSCASEIVSYFESLPEGLQDSTELLMQRGWFVCFFDDVFDDFHQKQDNLIGKSREEQDSFLEQYFTLKLEEIEKIIVESLPARRSQLSQSLLSHKQELYYLSIPTLLIFAESLCRDLANNIDLYGKHKHKHKHKHKSPKAGEPITADLFERLGDIDEFEEVLFGPLRKRTNLTKVCRSPRSYQKSLLNRHLIIHGQSDSYGSKSNSLKALSLAYYVFYTLTYLNERST
jgi:hypothetical protein